jgi:hypothetical protein
MPLVSLSPARADNDLLNQAQKLFNGNSDNGRDAYERGRQDQLRAQRAERDRDHWRRERAREVSREQRYRDDYGSNYR